MMIRHISTVAIFFIIIFYYYFYYLLTFSLHCIFLCTCHFLTHLSQPPVKLQPTVSAVLLMHT